MFILNKLSNVYKLHFNRKCFGFHQITVFFNTSLSYKSLPKFNTKGEIDAAKYNLHKKEYAVYENNKYGDYPKLPFKTIELQDPYMPFDHPESKRFFKEPVHIVIDLLEHDRLSEGVRKYKSSKYLFTCFILIMGGYYVSNYMFNNLRAFAPITEKQYLWKEKIYYTFEKVK